jgi:hypothetical protein
MIAGGDQTNCSPPLVDSDTLAMVHWVLKKDLQQLAPGDFEVVRDRFAFVPKDDQP